jgi:hypothetical protein
VAARCAEESNEGEARAAAEESLLLARELGDRRLLADALRRCAAAFTADGAAGVRSRYAESVALYRSLGRDDDTARALVWWGQWEAGIGEYRGAAERFVEAKGLASEFNAMGLATDAAACYLMMGDRARARSAAREALELAVKLRHPFNIVFAISYLAALAGDGEASQAARLIGFAEDRLRDMGWERIAHDRAIAQRLTTSLERRLSRTELAELFAQGAGLTQEDAVALAASLSANS